MCRNYNITMRIHIKWNKYEMTRDLSYVAIYFFHISASVLLCITLHCIGLLCFVLHFFAALR